MRRRQKRRLYGLLLLPPLLLAALFVWILLEWLAVRNLGNENFLPFVRDGIHADANASIPTAPGILNLQDDAGEGNAAADGASSGVGESGEQNSISLLFAGDINFTSHVLSAYQSSGGLSGVLDPELQATIRGADIFMANEEFPFSDRGTPAKDKEYTFRLPPDKVSILKEIGPDIVALANNHTLDYGVDALLDTCEILDQAGILHVGAGANLEEAKRLEVIEAGGKRIGFLASSHVIPVSTWAAGENHPGMLINYDPTTLLREITAAKEMCDYLVVYVHWGIERQTEPEKYQREQGRQFIDAGADLVVGSHPHVLQGIEYYKGKPIVHSLGNFVFGSSIPRTALLSVDISRPVGTGEAGASQEEPWEVKLSLIPCTSSAGYTRKLEEEKWPEFFSYMEELSFDVVFDGEGAVLPP